MVTYRQILGARWLWLWCSWPAYFQLLQSRDCTYVGDLHAVGCWGEGPRALVAPLKATRCEVVAGQLED